MAATTIQSFPNSDVKMRFAETYVSEGLNAKLAGVIPRGVYRGFDLVPSLAPLTAQLDPDSLGRHLAVYESLLGFSLTLRRSGGTISVPLTTFANSTVYVVLFAEYTISSATVAELRVYSVADYNSAPEKDELIVLGVVAVPLAGVIPPSAISLAERTLLQDTNQGWDTPRVFSKLDQDFGQDAFGASGVSTTADQDTIPHDYKLLHAYRTSQTSDVQVRCYSRVGGGGRFAITVNARWGGGANQTWTADDVAQSASKSSFAIGGTEMVGRLVTAAPWADAGWSFGESALSTKLQVDTVAPSGQLLLLQQFKYTTAPDVYARIYSSNVSSGAIGRGLVITINARFDTGTLLWVADNTAIPAAAAVLSFGSVFDWVYKTSTIAPWAVGDWTLSRSASASTALNIEIPYAPSPAGTNDLRAVASGPLTDYGFPNEYWVVCGETCGPPFGTLASIFASYADAKYWVQVTPGSLFAGTFAGVASDGVGRFVLVGGYAPGNMVIHTLDTSFGATVQRTVGAGFFPASTLEDVVFGGGMWVAVGLSGEIQSSPDGVAWTHRPQPEILPVSLYGIAYGNGTFVAVGNGPAADRGVILTSPNGVTWVSRTSPSIAANFVSLEDVAFGNGEFVAVGYNGLDSFAYIISSPDGITWTQRADVFPPGPIAGRYNYIPHIAYFSGVQAFAAHSTEGDNLGGLHVSLQGLDQPWSQVFCPGNPGELGFNINPNGAALASNGRRVVLAGTLFTIARTLNVDTF